MNNNSNSNQATPTDPKLHVRKKVAGGATGALLGAAVGGPIGAVLGGVVGTVVGAVAEEGLGKGSKQRAKIKPSLSKPTQKSGASKGKKATGFVKKKGKQAPANSHSAGKKSKNTGAKSVAKKKA